MTCEEALSRLRAMSNPANVAGMARFGINPEGTLGIGMPRIRALAREIGKDHELAERLWRSGIHEARILASLVDRPAWVDEAQMERWVVGFDSWDVCDQVCMNLFDRTPIAHAKACEWAEREEEFVRRAGFALMAALARKGRQTPSEQLESFFPIIARHASDGRNFVKKAVNWALRQIGKRDDALRGRAIAVAEQIAEQPSASARWIARDALRELRGNVLQ
ncbi:MAG TPA: DNA alkylation repair protein [Fimbriimonadaceae bacterium]|nr:DNA alkylation repair protein [Fimbriimonadaceae bacterium]